jgi:hypothetical protein
MQITTFSPSKNHHQTLESLKTPLKNASKYIKAKMPTTTKKNLRLNS